MIDNYHFIKYNSDTSIEHIKKYNEMGSIICFDLEDGIDNWINVEENDLLKNVHKRILNELLIKIQEEITCIRIGIRINSFSSFYHHSDIEFLAKFTNINSIIIPKVENAFEFNQTLEYIKLNQVKFNEILPLIESKKGIENLSEIINVDKQIKKLGFGHCDYNLDINEFPFFHQDTGEYWKWVEKILADLQPSNIKFINSAYLDLENSDFFLSILSHLNFLTNQNFGQFSLTSIQSKICQTFNYSKIPIDDITINRLNLGFSKSDLEKFINKFENENDGKAFTICSQKKHLMSPQEYCSAKLHLQNYKSRDVNFTFVGGCFPVQGDILFEDLFHQLLKKDLEKEFDVNININIIRYERFINCLGKIKSYNKNHTIDYLLFHIRPEPYLRLIKFYYKFLNNEKKLCRSLNIPFLNLINPEKYDILMLSRRYSYQHERKRTFLNKFLINLNYLAGRLIGNEKYALKQYLHLINEIAEYSEKNNITLILLGPPIRSEIHIEKRLSMNLERFMPKAIKKMGVTYVFGMDNHCSNGVRLFNINGIHATKAYHKLVSDRLYKIFKEKFHKNR